MKLSDELRAAAADAGSDLHLSRWAAQAEALEKALQAVADNEQFFGYDPYYSDIRKETMSAVHAAMKERT